MIEPVCSKRCKNKMTSSQTAYVRKPELVSCKTFKSERLRGRLIVEIYLNTSFQRARLGGGLYEIGFYSSIYCITYKSNIGQLHFLY